MRILKGRFLFPYQLDLGWYRRSLSLKKYKKEKESTGGLELVIISLFGFDKSREIIIGKTDRHKWLLLFEVKVKKEFY